MNAKGSGLSFDAATGQYTNLCKTERSPLGTCADLVLRFATGRGWSGLRLARLAPPTPVPRLAGKLQPNQCAANEVIVSRSVQTTAGRRQSSVESADGNGTW